MTNTPLSPEIRQPDSLLRHYGVPNDKTLGKEYFIAAGMGEVMYLGHIYQRLKLRCPQAVDSAAKHMTTITRGFGHNRFRSKFARQLKHGILTQQQQEDILDTILTRLQQGDIDEQFVEQLRFARWLNKERTLAVASKVLQDDSQPEYVICYAKQVLRFGESPVSKK